MPLRWGDYPGQSDLITWVYKRRELPLAHSKKESQRDMEPEKDLHHCLKMNGVKWDGLWWPSGIEWGLRLTSSQETGTLLPQPQSTEFCQHEWTFKVDYFLEIKASAMILALSIKHNLAHASMHMCELINGTVLSHQGCGNVVQRNRKLTGLIIMMGWKNGHRKRIIRQSVKEE